MFREKMRGVFSRAPRNPGDEHNVNDTKLSVSLLGLDRCRNNDTLNRLLDRDAWRTIQRLETVFRFLWFLNFLVTFIFAIVELSACAFVPFDAFVICLMYPLFACYTFMYQRDVLRLKVSLYFTMAQVCFRITILVLLHTWSTGQLLNIDPSLQSSLSIAILVISVQVSLLGATLIRRLKVLQQRTRIVQVIGLDGAGKSSLMYHIAPLDPNTRKVDINPTPGLELFHFRKWDTEWRVFDLSGSGRNRELWSAYYSGVHAIVFVMDATDSNRVGVVKDELHRTLMHPEVKQRRPLILILVNKSDLCEEHGGITLVQARNVLQVDSIALNYRVKVLGSSGMTGAGVQEGFQWIKDQTHKQFS